MINILTATFLFNQAEAEPLRLSYEQVIERAIKNNPQIAKYGTIKIQK